MSKGVVDGLEVVDIDEQHPDLPARARAAREHLFQAVADQRSIRQPGQRVVGRHERELFLAPGELGVGSLALAVEALGDFHEAELEAQLDDRLRLRESLG